MRLIVTFLSGLIIGSTALAAEVMSVEGAASRLEGKLGFNPSVCVMQELDRKLEKANQQTLLVICDGVNVFEGVVMVASVVNQVEAATALAPVFTKRGLRLVSFEGSLPGQSGLGYERIRMVFGR